MRSWNGLKGFAVDDAASSPEEPLFLNELPPHAPLPTHVNLGGRRLPPLDLSPEAWQSDDEVE